MLARTGLAFVLGAGGVLALPPFGFAFTMALSLAGLFALLERCDGGAKGFLYGWSFGLGFFLLGLHWIANSFFVDAARFAYYAPPAIIALAAYLSLFPALASAAAVTFASQGLPRAIAFAAAWTLSELARGAIFSGFPWNLIGYAFLASDAGAQGASVVGTYGLGGILSLASALGAHAMGGGISFRGRLVYAAFALVLLLAPFAYGALRLATARSSDVPDVRLRIVQGNVPQAIKWEPTLREYILDHYIRLTNSRGTAARPTVTIWPETAVPFLLAQNMEVRHRAAAAVAKGSLLISGSVRRENASTSDGAVFNSVLAIGSDAAVIATYDKVRLVPFGEYVPLRGYLSSGKLTVGDDDFSPGPDAVTLDLPELPAFQPLICYEAIFPDFRSSSNYPPPAWLLNLTNDAWFGATIGPYQHLAMARMRAIERGLPLVRAANTGISAVIDSYGRTVASLPLNETGVLDAPLPASIVAGTPYQRWGDWPVSAFSALAMLTTALMKRAQA